MAFTFLESFDPYATPADMAKGYWDSASTIGGSASYFVPGRFTGQAIKGTSGIAQKTSGSNDSIHHFSLAFFQAGALTGTSQGTCIQLQDGATNQCCLYFRTDGAIYLTRGAYNGTVVANWFPAFGPNQWNQYEIEVVISTTVGRLRIRVNGNTTEDYDSGATLNTQATANAYANRITFSNPAGVSYHQVDDFIWRSDTASLPWIGDLRCFSRRANQDVQAQWTPNGVLTQSVAGFSGVAASANRALYTLYVPTCDGTIPSAMLSYRAAYPGGSVKCALFNDNAGVPGTVLATATNVIFDVPGSGPQIFTFPPGVTVTNGQRVWLGFCMDITLITSIWVSAGGSTGWMGTTPVYASWPAANPGGPLQAIGSIESSLTITPNSNAGRVNEPQQDSAATYVSSLTPGQTDLYSVSGIASTPSSVYAIVTRAYLQKSDAGTRTVSVLLKSGGTTVQTPSVAPNTSWTWVSRTDFTDPNGGGPLTALGVNNMQIGITVTA